MSAREARSTAARVAVESVDARSSVHAWVFEALVDVVFTIGSSCSKGTVTFVAVDAILAGASILTGIIDTLVDLCLAEKSCVSRQTLACV